MGSKGKLRRIYPDLLWAGLRHSSRLRNRQELAAAIGISHVSLSALFRKPNEETGETIRARQGTVSALEEALALPRDWLVTPPAERTLACRPSPIGFTDESREPMYPDVTDPTTFGALQLVQARFASLCYEGILLELEREYGSRRLAEVAYDESEHWKKLEEIFLPLIDPEHWIGGLIRAARLAYVRMAVPAGDLLDAKGRRRLHASERPVKNEEDWQYIEPEATVRAVHGLVVAWSHILEPWYRDGAPLDYDRLREIHGKVEVPVNTTGKAGGQRRTEGKNGAGDTVATE